VYQFENDMYFSVPALKLLGCQPEPVEGGFIRLYRVRQAHPDTPYLILTYVICKALVCVYKNCLLKAGSPLEIENFQTDTLLADEISSCPHHYRAKTYWCVNNATYLINSVMFSM